MRNKAKLLEYLENIDQVRGWCIPQLWNCIEPVSNLITEFGIDHKPIGEIGVHHGKFFLGLALTLNSTQVHEAMDVFDMQEFNLDQSGQGNLNSFRENLAKFGVEEYEPHTVDSLQLSQSFILEREHRFSMFSVDGCHTPEHTVNDLEIAVKVTDPAGVIYLDDYYNPNWPGVQEGYVSWMNAQPRTWVPFLFTCNKLFLCKISYLDRYLTSVEHFLTKHYPSSRVKKVSRFGYDSLTVRPALKDKTYLAYEAENLPEAH